MDKVLQTEKNFKNGCNCCQAVILCYTKELGMTEAEALRLGSLFGGGFGKLREVCGAVSGMTMIAGVIKGYDDLTNSQAKKDAYALERKLAEEFKKRHNSIICREILNLKEGEDKPEPSVRDDNYYNSRPCLACVKTATEILEKEIFGK